MATTARDELWAGFVDPPREAAPMMRWWWFGPSVERGELDRELVAMQRAGLGGAEVSFVYPLEPARTTFGSPELLADLRWTAERARELGLRLDITLGSGWSFGGPHIGPDLAARTLHWDRREITPGPLDVPVTPPWPGDELVGAWVGAGSIQESPDRCDPVELVDGVLRIPDGTGPRQVLVAWSRLTGQNVKRATVGSEGPVLDHYSAAAVDAHLRAVGDPLLDAVPAELLGSVFCDSLEVYEADWTADLVAEFTRRRGYDPLPLLPLLVLDGPDAERLRADHHRTLTELYEERFVARIRSWAADRGVAFRIQGYGTPPATISSYAAADLVEGEGWGWTSPTQTRWATSAAHLYDRRVVSSETWTWVHSPSFRATPLDLQGEAHEHLLAGINQLIGHGWPYSPADAPGLGWFFYASGALDDRNPWWPAAPGLFRHLTRLCWLLRQGDPVADVHVLVPTEDVLATMGRSTGGSLDAWRETARLLGDDVTATLRRHGWDYDLVDEAATAVLAPTADRVIIVPRTRRLTPVVRDWLDRVITAGGLVIMVESEADLTGATTCSVDDLAATVTHRRPPDVVITGPGQDEIGAVRRVVGDVDVRLLANTGRVAREVQVAPRERRPHAELWDPTTGALVWTGQGDAPVPVRLEPYQALVLITSDTASGTVGDVPGVGEPAGSGAVITLTGWTATHPDGVSEAVDLPHAWDDDPARRDQSGAVVYTATAEVPEGPTGWTLDLGATTPVEAGSSAEGGMRGHSFRAEVSAPVRDVAVVRVNGVDLGVVWAPPYRLDVSAALRPGANEIEIEVRNTLANRLAVDEAVHELTARAEARDGRRFRMQELDRAMVGVRSGLLGVPVLRSR